MSTSHFGPVPTIWHPSGISTGLRQSEELLLAAKPRVVQLHTWGIAEGALILRRMLPDVRVLIGCGIDGVARDVARKKRSVDAGVNTLTTLAQQAVDAGALAIVWNAEAAWKSTVPQEKERLHNLIKLATSKINAAYPGLLQWHTAYDHPTYHGSYPWASWLAQGTPISASLPQVYAAPGGEGAMARLQGLQRREAASLASWGQAVRRGWIAPDAPEGSPEDATDVDWHPYYQAHSVPMRDTVLSAVGRPTVCLWAYPRRADAQGILALKVLCFLHNNGFWTRQGVQAYQASAGLKVDGVVGPMTLKAMGL